eukprot:GGOE01036781.1.p1 GENE.GGOE01036781.1~~GGOE01036781.1.p1  ORF type:complete len:642 (+),score=115.20 GGOE01036781.1:65-1990(+)
MEEFIERLFRFAARHSPVPVLPDGDQPVDLKTGKLRLKVGQKVHELELVLLYVQYGRLKVEEDREKFVEHVLRDYLLGNVELQPMAIAALDEYEDKLMPLLVSEAWVREKSHGLPEGITLPTLDVSGQRGFTHGLGVLAIIDFGEGCAPVTSQHLQAWGRTLMQILPLAVSNLQARTPAAPWHTHLPGCASSTWCDGYDATRALLMPELVATEARKAVDAANLAFGPQGDGELVIIFATQNQCVVSGSRNPIALCYMGEMVVDVKANHLQEFVSDVPFRLVAEMGANVLGSHSVNYHFEVYVPQSGECSIPKSKEECDAILGSLATDERPAPSNPDGSSSAEREAGNARFRCKDWAGALQHYTTAMDKAGSEEKVMILANRAAAFLELHKYSEAVQDCSAVLAIQPRHPKAWYRRGVAHQCLNQFERALADFEQLKLCAPDATQSAAAESQAAKTRALQRNFGLSSEWEAQVTAIMRSPPSSNDLPALLSESVGWRGEMNSNGLPGWIPSAVTDSVPSRKAAIQLYAMVRDNACTKADAAVNSAYTFDAGPINLVRRRQALQQLAFLQGDRSLVLLMLANRGLFSAEHHFLVPVHQRTLSQVLACIASVEEIKAAAVALEQGMAHDAQFQAMLQHPNLHFS